MSDDPRVCALAGIRPVVRRDAHVRHVGMACAPLVPAARGHRSPELDDEVRVEPVAKPVAGQKYAQRVAGVLVAEPKLAGRLGVDGRVDPSRQLGKHAALLALRQRPRTRDDHRSFGGFESMDEAFERLRLEMPSGPNDGRCRTRTRATRGLQRVRFERLARRNVHVNRARFRREAFVDRLSSPAANRGVRDRRPVRKPEVVKGTDVRAEQALLIHRLRRSRGLKLGRPVCGQQQHRHARKGRFDDRRIVMSARCAGRAQHRRRPSGYPRLPEGEKRRRPFVDDRMHSKVALPSCGEHQRRRPRPRADHDVLDAGGAERIEQHNGPIERFTHRPPLGQTERCAP